MGAWRRKPFAKAPPRRRREEINAIVSVGNPSGSFHSPPPFTQGRLSPPGDYQPGPKILLPTFPHRKVAPAEGGHHPPAASGASQALRKAFISPGLTDKKSTRQLRHRQNLRVVCFTGSQLDLSLLLLAFQVPCLYSAGKKRGQCAQAP